MKIRGGFVSNSSSTSFVCNLCNRSEFGWDWDEACGHGMAVCEHGHMMCIEHFDHPDHIELYKDIEVESKYCPICNLIEERGIIIQNNRYKRCEDEDS